MKLVKIKALPKARMGKQMPNYTKDFTGLGTYLHDGPVEMQLEGVNPIVGGPFDVMATDEVGQTAYIPAGQQTPVYMQGKVKEIPMMKKGGKTSIEMSKNKSVGHYNPHRDDLLAVSQDDQASSEKDVATSLKSVKPEEANVEAEKGEVVLKPDLMGMHMVKGNTHAQGGTHLSLDPGSFIFSNDPTLAIDKNETEMFDLCYPTSRSDRQNTPAKTLLREVKPKEYNSLVATLNDKDKDNIAKNTAAMMLQKYQQKIGQVAYIQEAKKGDPIPDFAMGTAPFVDGQFEDVEQQEKQYAQRGGPRPYPGGRTLAGSITATNRNSRYDFPYGDPREVGIEKLAKAWDRVGINIRGMSEEEAQGKMYDWALQNNPGILQTMWADWGMTNKGEQLGLNVDDTSVANLPNLRPGFVDGIFGGRQFMPTPKLKPGIPQVTPQTLATGTIPTPPIPTQTTAPVASENIPSLGYDIKGRLTDAQLAHLGAMGLNAMSVKKYYPKKEQVDLPMVNLDTINEQPYINDVNNQSFQAYRSLNSGDPRMARINASNIYGRGLDAISQVRGNVQNQNTQIQNQENLTNLQQATNQVVANTQYDDQYFDQVQTTRENFDRERRYANNALLSQLNQYQSQADALAWGLASVNKYGRRLVTDPKTGKKYYQPVPLFEANQRGIRYNADVADLNLATGADRVNSTDEIQQVIKQFGLNPQDSRQLYAFSRLFEAVTGRGKTPVYQQNPYLPNQ